MSKLFFDYDGTLIDISQKHYRVYSDTLKEFKDKPLSQEKYWKLRRMGKRDAEILKASKAKMDAALFGELKRERLEGEEYLKFDKVFSQTIPVLKRLSAKHTLYIVTLRHHAERLEQQLRTLKLWDFFIAVQCGNVESKKQWLESFGAKKSDWMIGDSEADVKAGLSAKVHTVAVTTGVRGPSFLKALKPNFIVSSLSAFEKLVK